MSLPAETPFFSVIIPSFNYGRYLPRTLSSVFAQGGQDYEVVLVDDGSTDQTQDVVRTIVPPPGVPFTAVHQENQGPSAARKHGLHLSTGQVILFLDADDSLLPGALDRFRAALLEDPSLVYALGGYELVRMNGRVKYPRTLQLGPDREKNFRRYLRHDLNIICCGCLAVRRQVFDRITFPGSDIMWEDIIFNAHLLALFDGVSFPDPVARIMRHADSLGHNQTRIKREFRKPLDLLFDASVLPGSLMNMRQEFLSMICLQQFTFLYKRGLYAEAEPLYREAIRTYPRHVVKFQPLRRYLSVALELKRENHAS
jgi:glycosyltransferase involved in cell wall biosynthesis